MTTVRCIHSTHLAVYDVNVVRPVSSELRKVWTEIIQRVEAQIRKDLFDSYFSECRLYGENDQFVVITVRSAIAVEKIETDFLEFLKRLWENFSDRSLDLIFCDQKVAPRSYPLENSDETIPLSTDQDLPQWQEPGRRLKLVEPEKNHVGSDMLTGVDSGELVTIATWNRDLRFDNFAVGHANQTAYNVAKQIVDGQSTSFNPVYLFGDNGVGKTHLLSAIANGIADQFAQKRILYLSAEKFLTWFVSSIRNNNMSTFKENIRNVDFLLIDDIHIISGRRKTEEEFLLTISQAVAMGRQVILSGDCPPVKLEHFNSRIHSLLEGGLPIELREGDFELRKKILMQKIIEKQVQYPEFSVSPQLLDFLAGRVLGPGRVLEGAINRVLAQTVLNAEPVTLDNIKIAISNVVGQSDKRITVDEIQKKVAQFYDISPEELLSSRRTKQLAFARQMAMYLCRTMTTRSYPDISKRFRKKDHTTVMHAMKKITELQETDPNVANDIELLTRQLRIP